MKRRVTFHIGLEKTGTDSFQRFCAEQRGLLARHATLYPTRSLAFADYSHAPLAACYLDYRDYSITSSGRPYDAVIRSLSAEIEASPADHILISAEHLSSRFRDAAIDRLAADFATFDCRIAVVVRPHRARLCAAYSQSVRAGRALTLDAYCDEVLHPANPYMRYATTIAAWERVFGRDHVRVFCHASGQDIVPVLCRALISADFSPPATAAFWDNRSTGPVVTEWLRRFNSVAARIPGASHRAVRTALRGPRQGLTHLLKAFTRDDRPWELRRNDTARLAEIAALDTAWLQEHYGIRLDGRDQSAAMNSSTAEK
jgi:hypothetical protein